MGAEGPPEGYAWCHWQWVQTTEGRPWFENDAGCYIYWSRMYEEWWCYEDTGEDRAPSQYPRHQRVYEVSPSPSTGLPPAAGWERVPRGRGSNVPAPDYHVVVS